MTHIIALAGRKQSGKTTSANFLHGHEIKRNDLTGKFTYRIDEKGQLVVRTVDAEGKYDQGVLDINQKTLRFIRYAERNIWPYIKNFSFAETLKDICVEVLGLDYEQCHGTDDQKNSLTTYRWENMPGVLSKAQAESIVGSLGDNELVPILGKIMVIHDPGFMTGREVMQYVGTDVFRKMNGNIWVNCCLRQIENDDPEIAVISDCRFLNEVEAIKSKGGKVIYLTRGSNNNDQHQSEKDLDGFDGFDAVIDNENMGIDEQNEKVLNQLVYWGVTQYA